MLGIHTTPQLPIWVRKFQTPSSIHGASFIVFFNQFFKNWPTMNFFPTSLPPSWSNAPCPFVNKGHQTIATSLWLKLKFCIQTILKAL